MPIPESQLDTWSGQGAGVGSRDTYDVVLRALEAGSYNNSTPTIFLQGSYGNDTNVWSESDVDVVIRTDDCFYHDITALTPEDQAVFHSVYSGGPPSYGYSNFKDDVTKALADRFGESVAPGKRAIAIAAAGKRRSADVIVAALYRNYQSFPSIERAVKTEGICFFTSDWTQIVNYPQLHSAHCTTKHQGTNGWFKPSVRILKNMRRCLIDNGTIDSGAAPSYFLEGLLYNLPGQYFRSNFQNTIANAIGWLNGLTPAETSQLVCANEMFYLVRDYNVTWAPTKYAKFLAAATELWRDW
jgi:hypothetical protein